MEQCKLLWEMYLFFQVSFHSILFSGAADEEGLEVEDEVVDAVEEPEVVAVLGNPKKQLLKKNWTPNSTLTLTK